VHTACARCWPSWVDQTRVEELLTALHALLAARVPVLDNLADYLDVVDSKLGVPAVKARTTPQVVTTASS
jgi:hypothetical protein